MNKITQLLLVLLLFCCFCASMPPDVFASGDKNVEGGGEKKKTEAKKVEHKAEKEKGKEKEKKAEGGEGEARSAIDGEMIKKIREKQRERRLERIRKQQAEQEAAGVLEPVEVEQEVTTAKVEAPAEPLPKKTTNISLSSKEIAKQLDEEMSSSDSLDVVLLLDSSRSMQRTDPYKLREQGAKLLLRILDSQDRVAIYQFDAEAKEVQPFMTLSENRIPQLDKAISSVSNEGGFTDLQAGIRQAIDALIAQGRPNATKAVILLSDGKMDPRPSRGTARHFTEELQKIDLPLYRKRHVKLYTLSFSEEADQMLLDKLAQATGGMNWFANSVDQIHLRFSDLFLNLKKPQLAVLDPNGFEISSGIDEATFYINRKKEESDNVILSDPFGKQISSNNLPVGVRWYKAELFDIITVRTPTEGAWTVDGVEVKQGFATLLTNIKMQVQWPEGGFRIDDQARLVARLSQDNQVIADPQIKELLFFSYRVLDMASSQVVAEGSLKDDGQEGDQTAGDNMYSSVIKMDKLGEYKLFVTARSPTFTRQQVMSYRVEAEPVILNVVNKEATTGAPGREVFRVSIAKQMLASKSRILVEAKKKGQSEILHFAIASESLQNGSGDIATSNLVEPGTYEVQAKIEIGEPGHVQATVSKPISYVVAEHEATAVVEVEATEDDGRDIFGEPVSTGWALGSCILLFCCYSACGVLALKRMAGEKQEEVLSLTDFHLPKDLVVQVMEIKNHISENKRLLVADEQELANRLQVLQVNLPSENSEQGLDWLMGDARDATPEPSAEVSGDAPVEGNEAVTQAINEEAAVSEVKPEPTMPKEEAQEAVESPVEDAGNKSEENSLPQEEAESQTGAMSEEDTQKLAEEMLNGKL
ncbi:MAG: VWA domain-containing protein [Deltaproteobacteria bacterium]|nr:VWA domain-containing protein [Deltaproteobacteria bacterium]